MSKDFVKLENNNKYLNNVSLKCRYDLIESNKRNKKLGIEIGSHWNKNMPYPLIDEDLKQTKFKLSDKPIKELNLRNKQIFQKIDNADLRAKLNNLNHSIELSNKIHQIKLQSNIKQDLLYENEEYKQKKEEINALAFNDFINKRRNYHIEDDSKKKLHSFSFDFHSVPNFKKNKVIYDIKPIYMIKDKSKQIFLPKIKPDLYNSEILDTNYSQLEHSNDELDYDYSLGIKYLKQITKPNKDNENEKFCNNFQLISLRKGGKNKFSLKFLAQDLGILNKKNEMKEIKKEENNNNRLLYFKEIIIKDNNNGNKNSTLNEENKKVKIKKSSYCDEEYFIFDKKKKEKPFPTKRYGLNYKFESNERGITQSNNAMSKIEKKMITEYDVLKKYVNNCFEKDNNKN